MSALEHEIESTRERLATTIDELVHRTSPKTIAKREVSSVKAFFVEPASGSPRTDNIAKVVGGVVVVAAVFVIIRKIVR